MAVTANTFQNIAGTPVTPQFAEYVIKGSAVESDGGSKNFFNILHFARISGPGTMTEAQLYAAVAATLDAAVGAALSSTYVAGSTDVRFMDDPTRAAVVNANAIIGTVAGDRLPTFNAAVTRKNTYARGRSYRGSNHWGPIAESQTLLDNLTAAGLLLWQAVSAQLVILATPGSLVTPDGSAWRLMVLSPTLSNLTSNPISVTGSFVQTSPTNRRLGTMKRRKDRTGTSL